ncbi:MAG: NUDIX hydrolase [Actinomycetota bacterium]
MAVNGCVVRAAGGVIVRRGNNGPEVLLVHRPAYDDWSFPKGKLDNGESFEECAVREVLEETGIRCELVRELSATSYVDRRGRPKVVRYWGMRPRGGKFSPNEEVDEARWMPVGRGSDLLSYEHDREMLREIGSLDYEVDRLFLLRHGQAGKRDESDPLDHQRPLDARGRRHSEGLMELLSGFPIGRILSSPFKRCVQTVEPLAESLGLEIELRRELAEGASLTEIHSLLAEAGSSRPVLCTHGDVIFQLIGHDRPAKKGSIWMLERRDHDGDFLPVGYLPPPLKA